MIRENKYLVIKNTDIEKHLNDEQQLKLDLLMAKIRIGRLNDGKQDQSYVVVAADWPMYETVWGMVEAFVDGKPSELESLRQQLAECQATNGKLLSDMSLFLDSHEECEDFDGFTAQIVSMDDYHKAQDALALPTTK